MEFRLVALLASYIITAQMVFTLKFDCISCMTNPNWSFYLQRIPGLVSNSSGSEFLPVHDPLACLYYPKHVYGSRALRQCSDKCYKWTSTRLNSDGTLSVAQLRGCYENLVSIGDESLVSMVNVAPQGPVCYRSPSNLMLNEESVETCFCEGWACNKAMSPLKSYGNGVIFLSMILLMVLELLAL